MLTFMNNAVVVYFFGRIIFALINFVVICAAIFLIFRHTKIRKRINQTPDTIDVQYSIVEENDSNVASTK